MKIIYLGMKSINASSWIISYMLLLIRYPLSWLVSLSLKDPSFADHPNDVLFPDWSLFLFLKDSSFADHPNNVFFPDWCLSLFERSLIRWSSKRCPLSWPVSLLLLKRSHVLSDACSTEVILLWWRAFLSLLFDSVSLLSWDVSLQQRSLASRTLTASCPWLILSTIATHAFW